MINVNNIKQPMHTCVCVTNDYLRLLIYRRLRRLRRDTRRALWADFIGSRKYVWMISETMKPSFTPGYVIRHNHRSSKFEILKQTVSGAWGATRMQE